MAPADNTSDDSPPKPVFSSRRFTQVSLITLCACSLMFGAIEWDGRMHKDPSFSVRLTDVRGGLDPARSPVIRPDFHLTLRVDNGQIERTCKEELAITVFYGDLVVGWAASVPDFCVDEWSSAEVNVSLSHTDVLLTDGLRRRLAVELRTGELEFDVEMRMVFPKTKLFQRESHATASRQSLLFCSAKPGQDYAPCTMALLT